MTIEERKERFSKFGGCRAMVCSECVYKTVNNCQDDIYEDAKAIMKDMANKNLDDSLKRIREENKPHKYETPLTGEDRERIKELIRVKTEVPDLSAHFIQEINELCAELNILAATIGKLEQVTKGTDPVGKDDDEDALVEAVNVCVADVIAEAADVHNYLFVLGFDRMFTSWPDDRDHKLARWANRLNGVSDE